MVGGWVLEFTRLMLMSTQVEVVVEVGVELGNKLYLWDLQQDQIFSVVNQNPQPRLLENRISVGCVPVFFCFCTGSKD